MKFVMTQQAKEKLKKSIQNQISVAAKEIVGTCLNTIVDSTPMNSGRTLASWKVFKNTKGTYDAGSSFPGEFFYDPDYLNATNHLSIGMEPGRDYWEKHSKNSINAIDFKNPYNIYYITNGASTDSIGESSLDQNEGSRAALMDAGNIPGFNMFTRESGFFDPRGQNFFSLTAKNKINDKLRKRGTQK